MRKRILAFFLAGIMTFTMTPAEAFASMSKQELSVETEKDLDTEKARQTENLKELPEAEKTKVKEQVNQKLAEITELLPLEDAEKDTKENTEIKENKEIKGELEKENWQPPTGGLVQREVEVTPEMAANAEVIDTANAKSVNGVLEYETSLLGSQKYDSSWDIYSSNYIYNLLDKDEKGFWDDLNVVCNTYLSKNIDAVSNGDGWAYSKLWVSYLKRGLTAKEAANLYIMFTYSNPQYYFLDSSLLAYKDGQWVPFLYEKFRTGSARKKETAKLKAKIESMNKKVSKGKNDIEKAKIAHDLILKKVRYDHNYNSLIPNTLYHQSAYSVFCDDYTVCAGYTKAFEILMNAQGIDTIGVTSDSHAWNLICLNDSWYHLDCTWDDNYVESGYFGNKCYLFFNRSTSVLKGELDLQGGHDIEKFYKNLLPKCTIDSGATYTKIGTYKKPQTTTAAPKISQKRTSSGVRVTLSTTSSGADIYYTLDGKKPSSSFTKSYHYTKPFTIKSNVTIKAIAVCNKRWNSKISSEIINGKKFTVKFDTMGGQKISSQKLWRNGKVKKPANPKREKYEFVGWYKDKKYKSKWNFNTKITKNTTIYAKWKKVKVGKPTIKKVTNLSNRKAKIEIKKVSGIKGYEIRYAKNSTMKSPQKTTSKSNIVTINKLKKGSRCYIQVRAYKKDSAGKKVFGKWSEKKAVRIKK